MSKVYSHSESGINEIQRIGISQLLVRKQPVRRSGSKDKEGIMRRNKYIIFSIIGAVISMGLLMATTHSQETHRALSQIIIYRGELPYEGEIAERGVGITTFTLTVGEEMIITAQGVDEEGNDVPIWPTWKADKELSISVVEGRSKTAVVKALKEGVPVFFSAVYITDDGKKVTGEVMGEVKPEE